MKRLTYILSILALLVAFPYTVNATRQARDIIIFFTSLTLSHMMLLKRNLISANLHSLVAGGDIFPLSKSREINSI